jgi:hypothetical protein
MKKTPIFLIIVMLLCLEGYPQEVIKYPDKPLSGKPGRIVQLEEELTIRDNGENYYLASPRAVKIASDGTIFVLDSRSKLLGRFDQEGMLLRNYFKSGQGPGELSAVLNFFIYEQNLIVYDPVLQKLLWLDFAGNIVKVFKLLRPARHFNFVMFHPDVYYFMQYNIPFHKGKEFQEDVPYELAAVPEATLEAEVLETFPMSTYIISMPGGGGGIFNLDKMITAPLGNRYLFISRSQEYLIELFDAEKQKITRSFTREYERVKPSDEYIAKLKKGGIIIAGKHYSQPVPRFRNDIQNLFINKNHLWVMTSTVDKEKGILFDVFNVQGKYVDQFYIKFTEANFPQTGNFAQIAVSGEYLYQIESTPEETCVIRKYRMRNLK